MTKFRYGASVNTITHGSGITEYEVVREDGQKWICIRPQRQYTPLEHDVRKRGFERVPEILFGRERATCKIDDDGLIWYTDFVNQDEIYYRTLHDPDWLVRKLSERKEAISECKRVVREINRTIDNGDLTKSDCIQYLETWEELSSKLYPYMFLALMTDEMIIEDFRELLLKYADVATANAMLNDLLISEYTRNAAEGRYAPKKSKIFTFPPEERYDPEGEIVLNRTSDEDGDVLAQVLGTDLTDFWSSVDTYFRYRVVAPIVFQLSEENFYVGKSILIAMNHVVDFVGDNLLAEGVIDEKPEMQEMRLDELVGTIQAAEFE